MKAQCCNIFYVISQDEKRGKQKKKKVDIKQSQKNELVLLGVLRHSEFVKIAAALASRANKV